MITNQYGNNVALTRLEQIVAGEKYFEVALRATERAYRQPGVVFGESGRQAEVFYSVGVWTVGAGDNFEARYSPISAAYALADMWAMEDAK